MDTIFSRQNYRSSLLRKSFFRGARDVGRRSVWRFSGHLDFFHFPHFPIQTQCSFFTLHTIQLARKYVSELHRGEGVFYVLWHTRFPRASLSPSDAVTPANSSYVLIHPSTCDVLRRTRRRRGGVHSVIARYLRRLRSTRCKRGKDERTQHTHTHTHTHGGGAQALTKKGKIIIYIYYGLLSDVRTYVRRNESTSYQTDLYVCTQILIVCH